MVAFIGKHVNLDVLKLRKRKTGTRRRRTGGSGGIGGAALTATGHPRRGTDDDHTDGEDDDDEEEDGTQPDDGSDPSRQRALKRVLPGYNADGTPATISSSIPGTPAMGLTSLSTVSPLPLSVDEINVSPHAPHRRLEMKGHSASLLPGMGNSKQTGSNESSPRDKIPAGTVVAGTSSGRKKSNAIPLDPHFSPSSSTVMSPGRAVLKPRMARDDEYGLVAVAFDAMLEVNRVSHHQHHHHHHTHARKSKEKIHGNGGNGHSGSGGKRRSMVANIEAPIHKVLNTLKQLESSSGLQDGEIAQLRGIRKTLASMGSRDDLFAPVIPVIQQQGSNSELQDWLESEVGGGGQAQQHLRVLARRRPPLATRRQAGNSSSLGSGRDLIMNSLASQGAAVAAAYPNPLTTPAALGSHGFTSAIGPPPPLGISRDDTGAPPLSGSPNSGRHAFTKSLPSPLRGMGPNAITSSPNLHAIRWDLSRSTPSPLPTGLDDDHTVTAISARDGTIPGPLLQSSSTGALLSGSSVLGIGGRRGSKLMENQRRGSLGELGQRPPPPSSRTFGSGHSTASSGGNSSGDDSPAPTPNPNILNGNIHLGPSPGVTPLLASTDHVSISPFATAGSTPSPLQSEGGALSPRSNVFQAALAAVHSSAAATGLASSAPTTPALSQRNTSFSATSWTSQPVNASSHPPPIPMPVGHQIISPSGVARQFRERKSSLSRQDSARSVPVTFAPDTRVDPPTPTASSIPATVVVTPVTPTNNSGTSTTAAPTTPRSADLRVDTASAAAADKEAREKRAADEKAKALALMMSPKKKKSYSHLPAMAAHGGSFGSLLPALRLSAADGTLPSPLPSPHSPAATDPNTPQLYNQSSTQQQQVAVFSVPAPLALDQVIPREALVRASRARDMDDWNLDMWFINSSTMDHPLLYTSFVLFTKFGLFSIFNIEKQKFAAFILYMEAQYQNNPYHNRVHAADVTLGSNFLVSQSDLLNQLEDWEILSLLLASIIHDVDHPGNSNKFEIKSSSHRALTYNDSSPLENHHLAVAWRALHQDQFNLLSGLSTEQYESVRSVVIELVLATDLKEHFKLVSTLKNAHRGIGQGATEEGDGKLDSIVMMKTILKMADIGHSTKRQELHMRWSAGITEEFFSQGDAELKRGLELSPFCDRRAPNVATSQIGFFDFIALPLYTAACPFFLPPSARRVSDDEPPATPTGDVSTPNTPAHTMIDIDGPATTTSQQSTSSIANGSGANTAPPTPHAPTNVDRILEQALANKAFWKAEAAKADAAKEKKNTTPRGSLLDKKTSSPKSEGTTSLNSSSPTSGHSSSLSSSSAPATTTAVIPTTTTTPQQQPPSPAFGPAVTVGASAIPAPVLPSYYCTIITCTSTCSCNSNSSWYRSWYNINNNFN
jgi:hypothetical protein